MQTVLITGVDKGIGRALMLKFLDEDFFVIGFCLNDENIKNINEEILHASKETSDGNSELVDRLKIFQMDLSKPESIEKNISEVKKFLAESDRKINILINNAGVMLDRGETDLDIEKLRKSLEINLVGPANFTEHLLGLIGEDEKGGHIVNISSVAGSFAHVDSGTGRAPNFYPAYRISKAALNMYTNTLAERLRNRNIIVSSVHPGLTRTDMGGGEANQSPEEAAENIFKFAISKPETGNFWFDSRKIPW